MKPLKPATKQEMVLQSAKDLFDRLGKIPSLADLADCVEGDESPKARKRISSVIEALKKKELWSFPEKEKDNLVQHKENLNEAFAESNSVRTMVGFLTSLNRIARNRVLTYINELMDQFDT